MSVFDSFDKKKDFLICVDSDGCAMDTMDVKHHRCFGPCMVAEWGLEKWQDVILPRWNDINLYTLTRGINRFKGLVAALREVNEAYTDIEELDTLVDWVETSDELSNAALIRAIESKPESISLKKALSWSEAVNSSIKLLPEEEIRPFEGVLEALRFAHERADVAIVSSANPAAVLEEWSKFGLLPHTDVVLAQDAGSKAFCIGELLKKGYSRERVLMCGDAVGDMQAAEKNGVLFYPICVRREKESWEEFLSVSFEKLLSGEYQGDYAQEKKTQFLNSLGGK